GIIIRCPVEGIRVSGRNTQGVKLMNLDTDDVITDVARVKKEDDEDEEVGALAEIEGEGEGEAETDAPETTA
ncbi:MAG: DNA gyrase C-terminal beta-propeller domain-containing protein, partial [Gemmatimonadales bacterium]